MHVLVCPLGVYKHKYIFSNNYKLLVLTHLTPRVDLIRLGVGKQHHNCVSYFQARSLIPSLEGRFSEEELGGLLEDIQTKRSFQY